MCITMCMGGDGFASSLLCAYIELLVTLVTVNHLQIHSHSTTGLSHPFSTHPARMSTRASEDPKLEPSS